MLKLKVIYRILFYFPYTLYLNFKSFPLKDAVKFPIIVYDRIHIKNSNRIIQNQRVIFNQIRLGYGNVKVYSSKEVVLIWDVKGKLIIDGKVSLGIGTKISVEKNATLEIGSNFTVTAKSNIICSDFIKIGKECLFAWDITVMDTDFHKVVSDNGTYVNSNRPIIIENDVWIGFGCTILKGSIIRHGTVVGAKTIITTDTINENLVVSNNYLLRTLKENIYWRR